MGLVNWGVEWMDREDVKRIETTYLIVQVENSCQELLSTSLGKDRIPCS